MISERRLYLTEDERVVEADHPEAFRLLVGKGCELPDAVARRHGIDVPDVPAPEPPISQAELIAQRQVLAGREADAQMMKADAEALKAELLTRSAELDARATALETERAASAAERDTLAMERAALETERATFQTERAAFESERQGRPQAAAKAIPGPPFDKAIEAAPSDKAVQGPPQTK